jgi:hypothetical protein
LPVITTPPITISAGQKLTIWAATTLSNNSGSSDRFQFGISRQTSPLPLDGFFQETSLIANGDVAPLTTVTQYVNYPPGTYTFSLVVRLTSSGAWSTINLGSTISFMLTNN